MCSVLMSEEVCSTAMRDERSLSNDDDDEMQSDAPDKEVDQACCWFFKMALVVYIVKEEHIVGDKISQTIVDFADNRQGYLQCPRQILGKQTIKVECDKLLAANRPIKIRSWQRVDGGGLYSVWYPNKESFCKRLDA